MQKKLVDPNKLCMGCMAELERVDGPCPHCGFDINKYKKTPNSLPLYEILNGKYLIGRVIGMGGFGITYIGWDFYQCKKVCIKEYFPKAIAARNPDPYASYQDQISVSIYSTEMYTINPAKAEYVYREGLKAYISEAKNLSKFYLKPGIVSVRDFFYGNNTAYIVMEYIDGIDMRRYARLKGGRLNPDEVFSILKDVLKTLNEVHQYNIIHRDISPDNIMRTNKGEAKLIDFGAARDYGNPQNAPILLKQGYAPIEQYSKDGKQGPWTDVYSMCASIYYLLSGARIPNARKRREQDFVPLLQALCVPISEEQDMAIKKGLSVEAEDRYQSIAELYQALYGEPI